MLIFKVKRQLSHFSWIHEGTFIHPQPQAMEEIPHNEWNYRNETNETCETTQNLKGNAISSRLNVSFLS